MFTRVRSTTYVLMIVLGSISTLGAVVAGQQYLLLQAEKEGALIRRALDESSLIAMKALGVESNSEQARLLINKEEALRKTIIEGVYSSEVALIRHLEIFAIADFIAWCVVFALSGWALFLSDHKQVEQEKKGSG